MILGYTLVNKFWVVLLFTLKLLLMTFQKKFEIMQEGGLRLAKILKRLTDEVKPGVKGEDLEKLTLELIKEAEAEPAFKNYKPPFATKPYPYALCLSLNEVIVHGYPANVVIKSGDVVKLDLGMRYKKFFLDNAVTITVGQVDKKTKGLVQATRRALNQAIAVAQPGKTLGDIGWAIEKTLIDAGYFPIKNLCGHDIGEVIHGDLQVLNFGQPGNGHRLEPGMVFTIEPMASFSTNYALAIDEFIFKTADDFPAAHFEVTLAIVESGNVVLTPILI